MPARIGKRGGPDPIPSTPVRTAPALLSAVAAVVVLTGCSAQSKSKEADDYSGDQKAVVTIVDDLANNASKKDAKEICTGVLATSLADKLKSGTDDCADVISDQLDDASNYDIDVTKVTVTGNTAQVVVNSTFGTNDDTPRTLTLAKQDNDWRITGIQ